MRIGFCFAFSSRVVNIKQGFSLAFLQKNPYNPTACSLFFEQVSHPHLERGFSFLLSLNF
ncbi:hypothetical protein HAPS_1944 [Glaesserella parasuis SH0165]|uniref:Uncharacterized protein n=1 Tax=Glaesserella parasuis serovar 5 (strain SH0165) TaxID=557723 RepID=B8F7X6_GLAP5|nr:hypothetical protein HAPS_1944 [Glaesserella parasuis SH0165]